MASHKHQCGLEQYGFNPAKGCGYIWEHEDPDGTETKEVYANRHVCPQCGNRKQLWRMRPTDVSREEIRLKGATILLTLLAATLRRLEESNDERLFEQRK